MKTLTLDRRPPGGRGKTLRRLLAKAKKDGYTRVIFRDPSREGIVNDIKTVFEL